MTHAPSSIVPIILARVATARAALDDLEKAVTSVERGPSSEELLTAKTWPEDVPVSFRCVRDAARRGEINMHRAGRSPAVRRGDVMAWIESRPVQVRRDDDAPAPRSKAARKALAEQDYEIAVSRGER